MGCLGCFKDGFVSVFPPNGIQLLKPGNVRRSQYYRFMQIDYLTNISDFSKNWRPFSLESNLKDICFYPVHCPTYKHKARVQTSFLGVFPESTDTKQSSPTHSGHFTAFIWVSYSSIFLLQNWITYSKPQTQSQQSMSHGSWWETTPKNEWQVFLFSWKEALCFGGLQKTQPETSEPSIYCSSSDCWS